MDRPAGIEAYDGVAARRCHCLRLDERPSGQEGGEIRRNTIGLGDDADIGGLDIGRGRDVSGWRWVGGEEK